MPPLPPSAHALTTRLNALSDSNKSIQQLTQRLAKLDFQPGSQPLDSDEGNVRLELSAEIHESLKALEEDLELLKLEAEDFLHAGASGSGRDSTRRRESARDSTRDSERNRLAVLLARLTEDLKNSRSQYRKAQLTAKHNAERAKLKERELLFSNLQSGTSTPSPAQRRRNNPQLSEGEIVTQASSDVTAALRRTHQLMQSELSRSRFAQETLEKSTAALEDLGEKYTDLNSLLASSRTLVTTLLKSQKSDTWYLETTFYVLITTLTWLIFRRWLYGPISWFLIFPIKLTFRILFAVVPLGASTAAKSSLVSTASDSATSLIVQPSATGGLPTRPVVGDTPKFVRVGGGGRGHVQDPSPPESLSQSVGQMAEENQQQQQQQQQQEGEEEEEEEEEEGAVVDHPQLREQKQQPEDPNAPVVRGDGTVLKERDRPANPKKKMWDEGVESAKAAEQERATAESVEGKRRAKRDEL